MPASSVLLLATDTTAPSDVAEVLTGGGHRIDRVGSTAELVEAAAGHQLIVVDIGASDIAAAVCHEIRAMEAVATIPIISVSPSDDVEDRIRLLEAGVDDVVARPFDARELEARVEALLLRFERSRAGVTTTDSGGLLMPRPKRTVVVFSPKGGAGVTTIVANLALAAVERSGEVVVIDLDLQFGQLATHLNIEPRQTIANLVRDDAALRDPEILRSYAAMHERGVAVLAGPAGPQDAATVTPAAVAALLETAKATWDFILIDGGSGLDEAHLVAFDAADVVIVPLSPEIASLKAVHQMVESLADAAVLEGKAHFVLNNTFAREVLKRRDIEAVLGAKIDLELPYDAFAYLKAVNEGVPVIAGAPRSAAAERLGQLASIAFGEGSAESDPATEPRRQRRFGMLRRA